MKNSGYIEPLDPAWRPMLARAEAVVDDLVAVSDVALNAVLAWELGWGQLEGVADESCEREGGGGRAGEGGDSDGGAWRVGRSGGGGGDGGPTTDDQRAMCKLLAMVGPLVVVRREELVVLGREEKAVWARIRQLERADDDDIEHLRLALPDELHAAFANNLAVLRELGGRRQARSVQGADG